jgi:Amt family ammonium transporter
MTISKKIAAGAGAVGASLFAAMPAWANVAAANVAEAANTAVATVTEAAPAAAAAFVPTAAMVNKGDTTWMLVSARWC